MQMTRWIAASLVLLVALGGICSADELTPEETVRQYLKDFKAGNFEAAYPLISKDMAQGKNKDDWAKEQQWVMQMAEVKIFDFHVYPGKIEGDKAYVPNLLSSQDKFLNQLGVKEHELYTLVREGGHWKINQQQIVEPDDLAKWFPPESLSEKKK